MAALFEAIKELYQRKSSLKIGREILRPCDSEIGKKQPHILKLEAIHKCMECAQPFSMMRKKYNCRACGVVSSHFYVKVKSDLEPKLEAKLEVKLEAVHKCIFYLNNG